MESNMIISLRCDQILLIDHTGCIFTCDGCARDLYLYVHAETQSLPNNIFCSEKYSFGMTTIRTHDLLINRQEPRQALLQLHVNDQLVTNCNDSRLLC